MSAKLALGNLCIGHQLVIKEALAHSAEFFTCLKKANCLWDCKNIHISTLKQRETMSWLLSLVIILAFLAVGQH